MKSLFCIHDWSVLSETVTKSPIEVTVEAVKNFRTATMEGGGLATGRKHIQIITCTKCGKLKRFVECLA